MKRKEEAMEALKIELDSAQHERHAKVWSSASSSVYVLICLLLCSYCIGGVSSSQPAGEQTAEETDIFSGEEITDQVLYTCTYHFCDC